MIVEPLQGKHKQAIGHTSSIVAFEGSVRSGKTWASLLEWLRYCRQGPAGPLVMTGKTERTLINNCILPLQQFLGEQRVKLNRGTGQVKLLGRNVRLVGANDEKSVTKIQGPTFAGAYCDEASTYPENFFNMLYSRLSVTGAQLWLTSNPEAPAHWLKVNWLDRARLWIDRDGNEIVSDDGLDLVRVSFKLEDNARNLSPAYIDRMKAAYTGLWYKRYILGEWCIAAGAVYTEWEPEHHVTRECPNIILEVGVGIDYGTTNPTRGYLIGVSDETPARLVVMDEWAPALHLTDSELSRSFGLWLGDRRPRWIAVDPSAESFKLQLFHDGHRNVMNGFNSVLGGIRTVASLMAADRLVVCERCAELIKEIPSYSWDPKATERGEDAPIKAFDHSCDALRYGVLSTRQEWGRYIPLTIAFEEAA